MYRISLLSSKNAQRQDSTDTSHVAASEFHDINAFVLGWLMHLPATAAQLHCFPLDTDPSRTLYLTVPSSRYIDEVVVKFVPFNSNILLLVSSTTQ